MRRSRLIRTENFVVIYVEYSEARDVSGLKECPEEQMAYTIHGKFQVGWTGTPDAAVLNVPELEASVIGTQNLAPVVGRRFGADYAGWALEPGCVLAGVHIRDEQSLGRCGYARWAADMVREDTPAPEVKQDFDTEDDKWDPVEMRRARLDPHRYKGQVQFVNTPAYRAWQRSRGVTP